MLAGCLSDDFEVVPSQCNFACQFGSVRSIEFGAQLVGADGVSGMAGSQADNNVAQFANIAGKAVVQPQRLGFRGELERLGPNLGGVGLPEVLKQQQAVETGFT